MPEGPELRVTCDNLNKILTNQIINDFKILSGRYFPNERNPNFYNEFVDNLPLSIKEINVKGKLLYFILENDWIILNTMGMSGRWTNIFQKHCHIELNYNEKESMWFCDPRRFGTIKILKLKSELDRKLATLGPDLLNSDITFKDFLSIVRKHNNKNITKVLMNQSILSGCGNYIKSESLYRSGISPHNFVKDIEDNSLEKLFISLRNVMKESYLCQGATISTYYDINNEKGKYNFKFLVYGRKTDDEGNIVIKEKTPDGRTSHWVKIKQK
tara:strand:+ start:104 stop:916 length:813 start_codon:yes stop_codon:yes gene_type:complete